MAGLFGGRLTSHAEVTILGSWTEGLEALRTSGIRIQENGETLTASVKATDDPSECKGALSALVLVKSWQTEAAGHMLAECLAPKGVALTLQNGLGNIEVLEAAIGTERAALGVTTAGAMLLGPGTVRAGGEGPTYVAPHPRLEPLVDLMETAGFEIHAASDLASLVWGKLAVNAGINALTALLEVRNGDLLERPHARRLMNEAAMETVRVAQAQDIQLPYDDPSHEVEGVATRTAENESSMLQDIRRGAPTEVDAINGAVVREGERHGVSTPVNWSLWNLVRAKVEGTHG
ncbi:MAG: 2-dehydropantoate 2-reductase [Anaerolineae bacterium]|nr:MAG: 2-dehydropantoate 2-reductase [Anaerolineae bacterium]